MSRGTCARRQAVSTVRSSSHDSSHHAFGAATHWSWGIQGEATALAAASCQPVCLSDFALAALREGPRSRVGCALGNIHCTRVRHTGCLALGPAFLFFLFLFNWCDCCYSQLIFSSHRTVQSVAFSATITPRTAQTMKGKDRYLALRHPEYQPLLTVSPQQYCSAFFRAP